MTDNEREAVRLLGVYTAGRFQPYMLAGNGKASCRQHVMSVLSGVPKLPRAKCGLTVLREALYKLSGVPGNCEAEREHNFVTWAKAQVTA